MQWTKSLVQLNYSLSSSIGTRLSPSCVNLYVLAKESEAEGGSQLHMLDIVS